MCACVVDGAILGTKCIVVEAGFWVSVIWHCDFRNPVAPIMDDRCAFVHEKFKVLPAIIHAIVDSYGGLWEFSRSKEVTNDEADVVCKFLAEILLSGEGGRGNSGGRDLYAVLFGVELHMGAEQSR